MRRILTTLALTAAIGGGASLISATPAAAMRAECQAHADAANWCFENGYNDWGRLEYAAYVDCLNR